MAYEKLFQTARKFVKIANKEDLDVMRANQESMIGNRWTEANSLEEKNIKETATDLKTDRSEQMEKCLDTVWNEANRGRKVKFWK
jgi:hypothetical protein